MVTSNAERPHPRLPEVSAISAQWTLRLRFGSFLGQLATIAGVHFGMGIAVPLLPLLSLVCSGLVTNIWAQRYLDQSGTLPAFMLPALLCFDVVQLTALLYLTGGPMNPFSFMYLVQIALATVVLPPRATWGLVALSLLGSGVLFVWHRPLHFHGFDDGDPMRIHLWGMWIAFSIAAGFIVYFLLRIRRALAQREAELEGARSLAARKDKLASLVTMAAGAAHELATPLGTIAVAAGEVERQLRTDGDRECALSDIRLIRAQVARCRSVLDKLAQDSGGPAGEGLCDATVQELLSAAQEGLPSERIRFTVAESVPSLRLPLRSLAQGLRSLLRNALDASPCDTPIEVTVRSDDHTLRIEVLDHGKGMSRETLLRIGEPFFSTRAPGQGLGLGVFLCRAVVESLSGQLTFESTPGQGTRAILTLPLGEVMSQRATGLAA